jgi:hypothetical protein
MSQFTSIDYANADLYDGLTQRPKTAIPLNIPLNTLKPKPDGQPIQESPTERNLRLSEENTIRERIRQENDFKAKREEEITRREQARRDEVRKKTAPAEPQEPRVTSRNPNWEQPTPTTKRPTQPPPPSAAKPPPTPNTSGARVSPNVQPTATPAPVAYAEPTPPGQTPSNKPPSSLPIPAGSGRFIAPGIGAGIDLTNRLVHGQSPAQAGFGAAGGFAGAVAGAAVGSTFGPLGTFVGGMIGGYVGGAIADTIYNAAFPPSAELRPEPRPTPKPSSSNNLPSQLQKYNVARNPAFSSDSADVIKGLAFLVSSRTVTGKIVSIKKLQDSDNGYVKWANYEILVLPDETYTEPVTHYVSSDSVFSSDPSPILIGFVPLPTAGEPPQESSPIIPPTNPPQPYYNTNYQPVPSPPSAFPSAGANPTFNNNAPSTITGGGTARGDAPQWMPHAGPAPGINPNPTTTPSNLGAQLPTTSPNLAPNLTGASANNPASNPAGNPAGNPVGNPAGNPANDPNQSVAPTPYKITSPLYHTSPKPGNFGDNNAQPVSPGSSTITFTQPSGIPNPSKSNPVPDAVSPQPKNKNPENKTPEKDPSPFPFPFIPPIPARAPDFQGPNSPNPPVPGSPCAGNSCGSAIQNQVKSNGDKLNQLNTLLNGVDLGLLKVIDNKLGPQAPGGLSTRISKLSKWLHLDRALNILIWWQTLHNAYMLSNNLGQTLTSAISNVLAVIGIKDKDDNPLDIGEILGKQFDEAAKTALGEKTWGGMKAEWKKYNRIYQAAANLLNSIQSIGQSILSALEVIGSWNAKIGNALRKWGEVGEKAYGWMNPTPNFQNKFFTALEVAENVVSQVDSIASEVLSAQDTIKQLGGQKKEFDESIKQSDDSKQGKEAPEASKVKEAAEKTKEASKGSDITDSDKEADED